MADLHVCRNLNLNVVARDCAQYAVGSSVHHACMHACLVPATVVGIVKGHMAVKCGV